MILHESSLELTPSTLVGIQVGLVEVCEAPLVSSVALLRLAAGPPSQPMLTSFFGAGEGLFYLSRLFFMLNTCSKCLFI